MSPDNCREKVRMLPLPVVRPKRAPSRGLSCVSSYDLTKRPDIFRNNRVVEAVETVDPRLGGP
jgi:hypothetical protein